MRTDPGLIATKRCGQIIGILVIVAIGLESHAAPACIGDCKGAGMVGIADLIVGVNIALGAAPVSACQAFANVAGAVDIAQLVAAVNNALTGCPLSRFVDNRDGTITDKQTGLMWEKKVGLGAGLDLSNPNAADNTYPWAGKCDLEDQLCQTDEAASTACAQGAQGDITTCSTCPLAAMGMQQSCRATPTIWDWLVQLNAQKFAGYADWRIPTIAELASMVDYTTNNPAVDRAFNGSECGPACTDTTSPACSCTQSQPGTLQLGPYWSSTLQPLPFPVWWFVEFGYGGTEPGGNQRDAYVRAVRGGAATTLMPRFVDNGDGTITDQQTGLMWEKKTAVETGMDAADPHAVDNRYTWAGTCSTAPEVLCQPTAAAAAACRHGIQPDQHPCDAACQAAAGLMCVLDPCITCGPEQGTCTGDPSRSNGAMTTAWDWLVQLNAAHFAGYADWSIPTEAELETLVDYAVASPALDSAFGQPACQAGAPQSCGSYWSATTADDCPSLSWLVTFDVGEAYSGDRASGLHIRAVRGTAG